MHFKHTTAGITQSDANKSKDPAAKTATESSSNLKLSAV